MKTDTTVLIIASGNSPSGKASPFIVEQAESLAKRGYRIEFFLVRGRGMLSYCIHVFKLMLRVWCKPKPALIHAHFVWSGLLAVLQLRIPVVVTFHGCDLNMPKLRRVSNLLVAPYVRYSILVNQSMLNFLKHGNKAWIPCGIDTQLFSPVPKLDARTRMGLPLDKKIVVFSSSFDREEKNSKLAHAAISMLKDDVIFIEFKGFSRSQSAYLYSAADCLLLTSLREGSPQVIKEAMSCNCPIVSTDVGDIRWLLGDTTQARIVGFDTRDVTSGLEMILKHSSRSNGRERIMELELDLKPIAERIDSIYWEVMS